MQRSNLDLDVRQLYINLDKLNLQRDANLLLEEIISDFTKLSDSQRIDVIDLYLNNKLGWVSDVGDSFETPIDLEKCLIKFIIEDQGKDNRDTILVLNTVINKARKLKLPIKKSIKKVVSLASIQEIYGWGFSTSNSFEMY